LCEQLEERFHGVRPLMPLHRSRVELIVRRLHPR
jgi:hypothetical protein